MAVCQFILLLHVKIHAQLLATLFHSKKVLGLKPKEDNSHCQDITCQRHSQSLKNSTQTPVKFLS